jgi:hypothetical protein
MTWSCRRWRRSRAQDGHGGYQAIGCVEHQDLAREVDNAEVVHALCKADALGLEDGLLGNPDPRELLSAPGSLTGGERLLEGPCRQDLAQ